MMIALFVFMALSRGTFSALSPVMAAQHEERKRRESVDAVVPAMAPRRHSDSPFHDEPRTSNTRSRKSSNAKTTTNPSRNLSRHDSNDSMKATNDLLLQKKLDDLLLEQQNDVDTLKI